MALLFEYGYLCRNCEDEFSGYPSGFRLSDALPLCGRCTRLGVEEGVATCFERGSVMPAANNSGIVKVGVFFIVVAFAVALAVYAAFFAESLR